MYIFIVKGGIVMISLEEAKSMMTKDKREKLRNIVEVSKPSINFTNKMNNDIVMQALCRAVEENIIHVSDLDDRLIKLLNSSTNTMSFPKLINTLNTIHKSNEKIACVITLKKTDIAQSTICEWVIDGKNDITFHRIFEYVIKYFKVTPHDIRISMTKTLKPTVVNNVAQMVSKYLTSNEEERKKMVISIRTITRIVNMEGHLLFADFKKM